jgi:RimJ/RimL family protein N-acetyltransferase
MMAMIDHDETAAPAREALFKFGRSSNERTGTERRPRTRSGATGLAPFDASCVPLLTSWLNDSEVYLSMGDIDLRPFTAEDGKRYVDSHLKDTWAVVAEGPENVWTPVGYAGIFVRSRHRVGIFRIAIGTSEARGQGHGYRATRLTLNWAFDELDLHCVHLSVSASNTRAVALYKKVGFVECGRYRESRWEDGVRHDEIVMEVLRGSVRP